MEMCSPLTIVAVLYFTVMVIVTIICVINDHDDYD